jgi:predicted DNA-binding transcriptional regulator AlpA
MSLRKNAPAVAAVVSPAVNSNPEPILTPEQVAERLQFPSVSTVYELTRTRKRKDGRKPLPALKAGKFLRFKWSMIERWLEESAA